MDNCTVEIKKVEDKQWIVVRSKPRSEKKIQSFCINRDITYYLPLRRSVRRYRNRVREFQVPIFSGYIFCQVSYAELSKVNECHHVAHILRPDETMELQLITELRSIQIFEEAISDGDLTVKPEIEVGTSVIIKTGPMAGLSGIVQRWKGKVRITVNVELVGQSVMLEVDAGEVDIEH